MQQLCQTFPRRTADCRAGGDAAAETSKEARVSAPSGQRGVGLPMRLVDSVMNLARLRFRRTNGMLRGGAASEALRELRAHSRRVAAYAACLARAAQGCATEAGEIRTCDPRLLLIAALLHDVGKVGVPAAILFKPARLDAAEFGVVKTHTVLGGRMIASTTLAAREQPEVVSLLWQTTMFHHERWDGSGYPAGLAGHRIPYAARLVSIVDVYDALSHPRCYKPGYGHAAAVAAIQAGRGSQFDPGLVAAFLNVVDSFPTIGIAEQVET
jgi:HD-GYP domain-containing protein (c-di-GMP phosphodiesterase class II)